MTDNQAKTKKETFVRAPTAGEVVYKNPNTGELVRGIISSMDNRTASSFIQGLENKEIHFVIRIPTEQNIEKREIVTLIEEVKKKGGKEIDYDDIGDLI